MLTSSFSRLLVFRPRKGITKHVIAFSCVGIAYFLAWIAPYEYKLEINFLALFMAIFLATIVGGSKAGFSATVFSVFLIVATFGISSRQQIELFAVRVGVFGLWGFGTSIIIGLTKNAYQVSLSVLNNIHSFVALLSPRGLFADVNHQALEVLNVRKEDIIGRHFLSKNLPWSSSSTAHRQLAKALKRARAGETVRFDLRFNRDFRQSVFVDFSLSPILDRQKNVIYIVASATEITSRIEAEAKANRLNKTLQQKLGELQTLFDVLPIGIAISSDVEGTTVKANQAFFSLLGLKPEPTLNLKEVINNRQQVTFIKNGRALAPRDNPITKVIKESKEMTDYEISVQRPDASSLDLLLNVAPIKNGQSEISGFVCALVDLTDRKKVEEALVNSELRFKRLVDSNLIGVIVTNLKGDLLEANEAFATMLGYTKEEILSGALNWRNITPPEFSALDEQAVEELKAKGEATPFEKEYFRKDGSRLPILIGAVMAEAKTETCVAFILDISARKKLDKRKDEFIGLASHELKTPLTSIKVLTQLLDRSFRQEKDHQKKEYISKMNQQIDRLTSLVEDLLDVSKIESGKLQLNYESFDFNQLAKDIIFEVQSISHDHEIHLEGLINGLVEGDAYRLGQVMTNLLTNAVKYSPSAPDIVVKLTNGQDQVKVQVIDRGVGVPVTEQKRIFEKFFRARGRNRHSFPGLGLGLYLSDQIIQRHGGKLTVKSQEGVGSTFTFTLPRQPIITS